MLACRRLFGNLVVGAAICGRDKFCPGIEAVNVEEVKEVMAC
jgi:hypothetical protein